jgi:hypothetical protein
MGGGNNKPYIHTSKMNIDAEEIRRIVERMKKDGKVTVVPARKIAAPEKPRATFGNTTCRNCNVIFTKRASTSMFCKRECYLADQRRERELAKEPMQLLVCPMCDARFTPKTRNNQTYCSPDCNLEAHRRRNRRVK